jgi:hypothetical protein
MACLHHTFSIHAFRVLPGTMTALLLSGVLTNSLHAEEAAPNVGVSSNQAWV